MPSSPEGTTRQLWQILLDEPTELTCEECFALIEYYAEVLASGGERLLPRVLAHLKSCPHCAVHHAEALHHLAATREAEEEGGSAKSVQDDSPAPREAGEEVAGGKPWPDQSA